jgi:hypothetical protein
VGLNVRLATGRVTFKITNQIKPHYGPSIFPINIKAGYTMAHGELRGRYSDQYKDLREDALEITYRKMVQKWVTAGNTKSLEVSLSRMDEHPTDIKADNRTFYPFEGEYETFSDGEDKSVVITKGGF